MQIGKHNHQMSRYIKELELCQNMIVCVVEARSSPLTHHLWTLSYVGELQTFLGINLQIVGLQPSVNNNAHESWGWTIGEKK